MEKAFIDLISITELAAIATHQVVGKNNKELADQKAVNSMQYMLDQLPISAKVVIGEGDIDQAPQLYLGQELGTGGEVIEIAVDPIEGTTMVAKNQNNAIAVMALTTAGGFFSAPDMYMEKLIVGNNLKGTIDLTQPITTNIERAAKKLKKPLSEMTVAILDKPRHQEIITKINQLGARVALIPDGDVVISIDICANQKYDMFYSIGGSPEGVINAAIVTCLDGDMQGRLVYRKEAKGHTKANIEISKEEQQKCQELAIDVKQIMKVDDLVKNDDVIVLATGITNGDLLNGVKKIRDNIYECNSIFIRKNTGTMLKIAALHDLTKKDQAILNIINN